MLPTDPEIKSGVPSEERSIIYGTALGLGTVIMGTKLLNVSPLQSTNLKTCMMIALIVFRASSFGFRRDFWCHWWMAALSCGQVVRESRIIRGALL